MKTVRIRHHNHDSNDGLYSGIGWRSGNGSGFGFGYGDGDGKGF